MKIFVLGLPHTQTNTDFTTCAFTMKAYHLCKMMHRRGHEVIHLGVEGSNPECSENIPIISKDRWVNLYGHPGTKFYNLDTQSLGHKEYHNDFAINMRNEIIKRTPNPHSAIICVTWGGAQQIATQDLPQFIVESGIGYPHTWAKYRVFESYAWMHMIYGKENKFGGQGWYDTVIPNAFDPNHFEYNENPEDYLLYFGRLNSDKGVGVACDVAKNTGHKIKIVGQGDPTPFLNIGEHVEYIPPVGIEDRKKLMANAKALLCPTWYIEPFGGVNIEAQMCGTPAISTDFGVFSETIIHGVTGYRCHTMEELEFAVKNINKLSRKACREWALNNYSLDRVALMYEEYFQRLLNLNSDGWYQKNTNRTQLDYLKKAYPQEAVIKLDLSQKLEIPNLPTVWEKATKFESNWWGLEPNQRWIDEVEKQNTYAKLMQLSENFDLKVPTTILDVGCGPTSILLRTNRHGAQAVGVDPLPVSRNTLLKYKAANITFVNKKAEEGIPEQEFDEAWIYNVLQHTDSPIIILNKLVKVAKIIRVFEWINTEANEGHPHILTVDLFETVFKDLEKIFWKTGKLNEKNLNGEYFACVVKC
jgi:glycosyltransferase involved in cell wall biosynthesis/2-polyprenyl-3-methyl-5-hydroxy-6-metoxy-1,4-benzoquinol methylase